MYASILVTSGKLKEQLLKRDCKEAMQNPSLFPFHVLTKMLKYFFTKEIQKLTQIERRRESVSLLSNAISN